MGFKYEHLANNIIKKVNRFQYYIELFKRDKSK